MTRSSQPSWRPSRPSSGLTSRNDPTHSNLHKSLSCTLSYLAQFFLSRSFLFLLLSALFLYINLHPLLFPPSSSLLAQNMPTLATPAKPSILNILSFQSYTTETEKISLFSKQIFILQSLICKHKQIVLALGRHRRAPCRPCRDHRTSNAQDRGF